MNRNTKVYSRDKKTIGLATGGYRDCTMEGCKHQRVGVRWPDGKLTWPCLGGMTPYKKGERIL